MPDLDQTAEITMTAGSLTVNMKARATPAGLLAVGGLVGCILLSTAVLVWTATSVRPSPRPLDFPCRLTRR